MTLLSRTPRLPARSTTQSTPRLRLGIAMAVLASGPLASFQAAAQTDALQARSMAASCANCHGTNGNAAPGMVALAGYDRSALVKNMADFKSGARPATIMHQLAKGYTDAQIDAIAVYFATQKK